MATDNGGLNTDELRELVKSGTLSEEDRRYIEESVLPSRGERKAVISSHEIVAGNPDAYSEHTVEEQADLAIGRPHEPLSAEDTSIRGNEPTPSADEKPAKASGSRNAK